MWKKNMVWWQIGTMIVLIWTLPVFAYGQKIDKCRVKDKPEYSPKYRIGLIRREIVDDKPLLLLQISVNPEYFNRRDMTALAHLLNKEFCKEEHLNVIICDDYKATKDNSLIFDWLTDQTNPAMRGFYRLDRASGYESIIFSTERKRSLKEVEINLAAQPQ